MLKFALCDDNLNMMDKLSTMLEKIFMQNDFDGAIVFKSDDVDKTLDYIKNNTVDVIFLDINLKSEKTGLQLAEQIRKYNKEIYIIFTTAHLEYVMVAYQYKTFDFLAKPITSSRLEETVKRLFDDIYGLPKKYIKLDNKNTIIDENEILYIKRDGMKLVFHTKTRDYEIYSSFSKITELLPENFVRCHKSFIVNTHKIKNIDPVSCTISLENNETCEIGPKYKQGLMEVFK